MAQLVKVPGGPNEVVQAMNMIAKSDVRKAVASTPLGIRVTDPQVLSDVVKAAKMYTGTTPTVIDD